MCIRDRTKGGLCPRGVMSRLGRKEGRGCDLEGVMTGGVMSANPDSYTKVTDYNLVILVQEIQKIYQDSTIWKANYIKYIQNVCLLQITSCVSRNTILTNRRLLNKPAIFRIE